MLSALGAALKKPDESKPRRDNKNLTGQPRTGRLPEGLAAIPAPLASTTRANRATLILPGQESYPIR